MLQSKINQTILYDENRTIDKLDHDFETYLYTYPINNHLTYIVLGNIDYSFIEQNLLFIRAYLYQEKKITDQVGIFEFTTDKKDYILDENEDIDLTKMDDLLTFSFVNEKYLNDKYDSILDVDDEDIEKIGDDQKDYDDDDLYEDTDEDDDNEDEDEKGTNVVDVPTEKKTLRLPDAEIISDQVEQTMEQATKERKSFKTGSKTTWIENFMKNNNYGLIDNEGGGDCFFAVIRDGLLGININVSVDELREIVSMNATESQFKTYFNMYDMYQNEINTTTLKINEKKSKYNQFKKEIKKHKKDRTRQKEIFDQAGKIKKEHAVLVKERDAAIDNIEEVKFMKNVKTLEDFKSVIMSVDYWADTWAISILERELNIKMIILSSANYDMDSKDNILMCGDMVDEEIRTGSKTYNPKFYIIGDHTGDHYKLVTYKNKRTFNYEELPYDVKELIITKCMENSGLTLYNYIPKFKNYYKEKTNKLPDIDDDGQKIDGNAPKKKSSCPVQFGNKDLYNENIVFQFYSKSADKKPGKNKPSEKMVPGREKDFIELSEIKNWRKVLSNFYVGKFELDGYEWSSVEHYYHANKFKKNNFRFYEAFSLTFKPQEDDPEWFKSIPKNLNMDPAVAKAMGGKTGKYKGVQIRPKLLKADNDFFEGDNHKNVLLFGQRAKYNQVPLAKKVLLATKDAKLQHFSRGCKPIVFYDTMQIREEMKKK